MSQSVYIYNYSGTDLNVEATSPGCTNTFGPYNNVCSVAKGMPSGPDPTSFTLQEGQQSGLLAQPANPPGPKPLVWSPLEAGVITVNEQTGALQFTPGPPSGGARAAKKT